MFYSDVLLCLLFMYVLVLSLTVFLLVRAADSTTKMYNAHYCQ